MTDQSLATAGMEPCCATCPYYFPPENQTIGRLKDCRRFPPPESGNQQSPSMFPTVHPHWICGEHPQFAGRRRDAASALGAAGGEVVPLRPGPENVPGL